MNEDEFYDDLEVGYAEALGRPIFKKQGIWLFHNEEPQRAPAFGFARALDEVSK